MVVQPSATDFGLLTGFASSSRGLPENERRYIEDRTIVNHVFKGRWRPLPRLSIVSAPSRVPAFDPLTALRGDVVQWTDEPKPWLSGPESNSSQRQLWWRTCKSSAPARQARRRSRSPGRGWR